MFFYYDKSKRVQIILDDHIEDRLIIAGNFKLGKETTLIGDIEGGEFKTEEVEHDDLEFIESEYPEGAIMTPDFYYVDKGSVWLDQDMIGGFYDDNPIEKAKKEFVEMQPTESNYGDMLKRLQIIFGK